VREPPPTQAGVGLLCLPTALQKKVFCIDFWKPHALLASETRRSQGCRAPWLLRTVGDWTHGRPFVQERADAAPRGPAGPYGISAMGSRSLSFDAVTWARRRHCGQAKAGLGISLFMTYIHAGRGFTRLIF